MDSFPFFCCFCFCFVVKLGNYFLYFFIRIGEQSEGSPGLMTPIQGACGSLNTFAQKHHMRPLCMFLK